MSEPREEGEARVETPLRVEVVESTGTQALAPVLPGIMVGMPGSVSLVDQLQRLEDGAKLVEQRGRLLQNLRIAAIRSTYPEDWVLTRDKASVETGMIKASGASKVNPFLNIHAVPLNWPVERDFQLEKLSYANNVFSYRLRFRAFSEILGVSLELESERRSDEDFTGRSVNEANQLVVRAGVAALEADLRAAVYQLMRTKACRMVGGMIRVPRQELDDAWQGGNKTTRNCAFGHGYGTASDRTAQAAGPVAPGTAETGAALWSVILQRTGGDEDTARSVLKDITSNPEKGFKGFDSAARLTQAWQLENAYKKLLAHSVFGDAAQGVPPAGSTP